MVTEAPARMVLPVPVLGQAHWRVVIRPEEFDAARIPSAAALQTIVEQARVRLRGWDYPVVEFAAESSERGNDWVASWTDFGPYVEYWRFHQSGQFIHLFGFTEDTEERRNLGSRRLGHLNGVPADFQPTGYVDFAGVLFRVTEILEFASRLALKGALGKAAVIEVGMEDIRDRVLLSLDPHRGWTTFCHATVDRLSHPAIHRPAGDLVGQRHEIAIDIATWFYERFGWAGWQPGLLREMQRKFLNQEWD